MSNQMYRKRTREQWNNRAKHHVMSEQFPVRARPTMLKEATLIKHLFQPGIIEAWVWDNDRYRVRAKRELQDWATTKVEDGSAVTSTLHISPVGSVILLIGGRYARK